LTSLTNLFSAAYLSTKAIYFLFFCKITYLNAGVNRTEPSPSVRVPGTDIGKIFECPKTIKAKIYILKTCLINELIEKSEDIMYNLNIIRSLKIGKQS